MRTEREWVQWEKKERNAGGGGGGEISDRRHRSPYSKDVVPSMAGNSALKTSCTWRWIFEENRNRVELGYYAKKRTEYFVLL
jgi:hypothetical protein